MAKHNTIHGQYGSPLYWAWVHMKARCAHHPRYIDVDVDVRWREFEDFVHYPCAGYGGLKLGEGSEEYWLFEAR